MKKEFTKEEWDLIYDVLTGEISTIENSLMEMRDNYPEEEFMELELYKQKDLLYKIIIKTKKMKKTKHRELKEIYKELDEHPEILSYDVLDADEVTDIIVGDIKDVNFSRLSCFALLAI